MKGTIESQLAEDYYNNVGVGLSRNEVKLKTNVPFEIKRGIPLTTKEANRYTNAVVYDVNVTQHRCQVTVLTDFGNMVKFPSIEDMLGYYDISKAYLDILHLSNEYDIGKDIFDMQFCLRDRLEKQIELLTEALEGLNGNS